MSRRQLMVSGLGFLLFLTICYFPLFLHLDALSLRLWDEARRGVNALEMARNGRWLVPHFLDAPDHWGTKPPLLIWLQAFFLKIIPSPELAIRLPSALAGLATACLLVWAGKRLLQRSLAGYFAALVLLTSSMYLGAHGATAGDYDALLCLWLTAHLLTFFLFVQERRHHWLYLSAASLLLAGWTKGVAAFFFVPGLFIFLLLAREFRPVLRMPRLYVAALLTIGGVLAYYWLREAVDPGYFQLVWGNELGGRYFEAKEGHGRPFFYYFRLVHQYRLFFPWQYLVPVGFYALLIDRDRRSFGTYLLVLVLSFLLILCSAATKLDWYILPVLPLLALVVGDLIAGIFKGLSQRFGQVVGSRQQLLPGVLLALVVFGFPYWRAVQKVYHSKHTGPERERMLYRDFFRQLSPDERVLTVLLPAYNGHFTFYQQWYQPQGYEIKAVYLRAPEPEVQVNATTDTNFSPATLVVVCEKAAAEFMDAHYQSETIRNWETCKLLRLNEIKNQQ